MTSIVRRPCRGRIWVADHNFFIEEVVRGALRQDPIRVFGGWLRLGQPGAGQDEKAQSLQKLAGTMKANHTLDGELCLVAWCAKQGQTLRRGWCGKRA